MEGGVEPRRVGAGRGGEALEVVEDAERADEQTVVLDALDQGRRACLATTSGGGERGRQLAHAAAHGRPSRSGGSARSVVHARVGRGRGKTGGRGRGRARNRGGGRDAGSTHQEASVEEDAEEVVGLAELDGGVEAVEAVVVDVVDGERDRARRRAAPLAALGREEHRICDGAPMRLVSHPSSTGAQKGAGAGE